ncbi:MAG TPA: phytoene desaturase family protein [Spirochaetia bacterium]|nr:phytoene desaturase family protein [Spirochaetia bacterium]
MTKKVAIIGAGFSGLSAAALLAKQGWEVVVLEKNDTTGGRARHLKIDGYSFDMGPTWYLMPEVFSRFFGLFGRTSSDFYTLTRLDPLYRAFFGATEWADIRQDNASIRDLFESFELGGAEKVTAYLENASRKYEIAMREFLYKDYRSLADLARPRMFGEALRLNLFGSLHKFVQRSFRDSRSRQLLEYSSVFLGSSPENTPALYSIMSYVDLVLGVSHPAGGMSAVAQAVHKLAESQGAVIRTGAEVQEILVRNGRAVGVRTESGEVDADVVLVTSDYPHAEMNLLKKKERSHGARYWKTRTVAPSMFIAFLGVSRKLEHFQHHNLYFAPHWENHFDAIFRHPRWPEDPSFYMHVSSRTDTDAAPPDRTNLFLLVPVAAGLPDTEELRERFFEQIMGTTEKLAGESILGSIEARRLYTVNDFERDYHAFQGTALGLSHTLFQTALFRPSFRSKKVPNLYFSGQYTHPGIGVPMTLIGAEVIAGKIQKEQPI